MRCSPLIEQEKNIFYINSFEMTTQKSISIESLAEMVKGQVIGDKTVLVRGFAPLDTAGAEEITFLAKSKMVDALKTTAAGAVIVPLGVEKAEDCPPHPGEGSLSRCRYYS